MKLISIVLASALLPATALASPQSTKTDTHDRSSATKNSSTESVEVEAFEWSSGQGRLGLMLEGLTPQLRAYFGAPNNAGLLVAQVASDSPAAKAGVKVGDVITQVNSHAVQSADDIVSATQSADSNVRIHVIRNHAGMDLQAMLGTRSKSSGS